MWLILITLQNQINQRHNDPGSGVVLTRNHTVNSLYIFWITLINSLGGVISWINPRSARLYNSFNGVISNNIMAGPYGPGKTLLMLCNTELFIFPSQPYSLKSTQTDLILSFVNQKWRVMLNITIPINSSLNIDRNGQINNPGEPPNWCDRD